MDPRLILPITLPLVLLASCGGGPADPATGNKTSEDTTPSALVADLPTTLIVSTNEPFQSAEVSASAIRLITPDSLDGQMFEITNMLSARSGASARRSWNGHGPAGDLLIEVTDTPCEDTMSGAQFPYSASIDLNSRRTEGCARPAGTPPPAVNPR